MPQTEIQTAEPMVKFPPTGGETVPAGPDLDLPGRRSRTSGGLLTETISGESSRLPSTSRLAAMASRASLRGIGILMGVLALAVVIATFVLVSNASWMSKRQMVAAQAQAHIAEIQDGFSGLATGSPSPSLSSGLSAARTAFAQIVAQESAALPALYQPVSSQWAESVSRQDAYLAALKSLHPSDPKMVQAAAGIQQSLSAVSRALSTGSASMTQSGVSAAPLVATLLLFFLSCIAALSAARSLRLKMAHAALDEQAAQSAAMRDIRDAVAKISRGNLLVSLPKTSDPVVSHLSSMLAKVFSRLAKYLNESKAASEVMIRSAQAAGDSTTTLIEHSRDDAQHQLSIRSDAERLASGGQRLTQSVSASEQGAKDVQRIVGGSEQMLADITARVLQIRKDMVSQAESAARISESQQLLIESVGALSRASDEAEVIAVQLSLQAAKGGESSKPFRVVVESIREFSRRLAEESRRSSALLEAGTSDIRSLTERAPETIVAADDMHRLSDVASSDIRTAVSDLVGLCESLEEAAVQSSAQRQLSDTLFEKASQAVDRNKSSQSQAQEAARNVMALTAAAHELSRSSDQFKT